MEPPLIRTLDQVPASYKQAYGWCPAGVTHEVSRHGITVSSRIWKQQFSECYVLQLESVEHSWVLHTNKQTKYTLAEIRLPYTMISCLASRSAISGFSWRLYTTLGQSASRVLIDQSDHTETVRFIIVVIANQAAHVWSAWWEQLDG